MINEITRTVDGNEKKYQGLSTDAKPVTDICAGSTYYELDTGIGWVFDTTNINPVTENNWWRKKNTDFEDLKINKLGLQLELGLNTSSLVTNVTQLNNTTTQITDNTVSLLNFTTLDIAIAYCVANKKVLSANKITLTENTTMRGIGLNIGEIITNGFTLELGGYYTPSKSGQAVSNPTQIIDRITPSVIDCTNQLYIRGAVGQHITINQYYGTVNLRMNETDQYNAYSTFNFGTVTGVSIDNDTWVLSTTSATIWCNENIFNINRCRLFSMNGTFDHNLNRIYGGAFEGSAEINIIKGNHNTFYDMRFEGDNVVKVHFHVGTTGNIIYRQCNAYTIVTDEGYANAFVTNEIKNARLLNMYSIKINSFNANYMGAFKNLILSTDGLGLKPNAYSLVELLETEFIENPQNAMFMMKCSRKIGNGLAVKYKVYDTNYNDISAVWKASRMSFYYDSCDEISIQELSEGGYKLAGDQIANSVTCLNGIYNDKITLYPSSYWQLYKVKIDATHLAVKYVKFFIISSSYFGNNTEVYDINGYIYDLASNYHFHYSL